MQKNILFNNEPANQEGQTLIETVIAIFILTSGITAALGLAIFVFASSDKVTKQMIAVGLAREGIEAVKNMRDTNWLRQTSIDTDCYNPKTLANNAKCYKSWIEETFCIDPDNNNGKACNGSAITQNYYLGLNPGIADYWVISKLKDSDNYGLDFDTNISGPNFKGFYPPSNSTNGSADFFRKIVITKDDGIAQYGSGPNNPFNKNTGPRLKVQSQVWWTDKKCPKVLNWPGIGNCSVELQTYLTNWKDF